MLLRDWASRCATPTMMSGSGQLSAHQAMLSMCVLVYSDDLLVVALDTDRILLHMDQHFKLKDGSVGIPERHLGADIGRYTLRNGKEAWHMSSEGYVKAAIKNVEAWLEQRGDRLKTKAACVLAGCD